MRSSLACSAVALALATGCATAETPPPVVARPDPPQEVDLPSGTRSAAAAASLFTLHYAIATSIRAHPSGDVVLTGCTEGPTDLRPTTEPRRVLGFVARVDPRGGRTRWVRHLDIGPEAFENQCWTSYQPVYPGPRARTTPRLVVDAAGRVYVSAFTLDPAPHPPALDGVAPGTVVLALSADDGSIRWQHHVGVPADLAVVTHLVVASDGGVDALVRRHARDGLDTFALVHLDADGRASERASLRTAAMPSRRTPCHVGASGCRVEVDWLARAEDGSLAMSGTLAGVELSIGSASIPSPPDGVRSEGFWASLERDGALRWLRSARGIFPTIVRAHDHEVVATTGERVERVDTETGARRPWSRSSIDPAWPLSRTLRLYEQLRARLTGATLAFPDGERALAPPAIAGSLTPELLGHVQRVDPEGPAPHLAELPDGSLAWIVTFQGEVRIGEQTARSAQRMVACHPGPVGEERSMPPGCREPLDRPAALLLVLSPRE